MKFFILTHQQFLVPVLSCVLNLTLRITFKFNMKNSILFLMAIFMHIEFLILNLKQYIHRISLPIYSEALSLRT